MKNLVVLLACMSTLTIYAKNDPGFVGGKIFAKGFDPVSYLLEKKAFKGSAAISHVHKDTKFYFYSEENKKKFVANPQKYTPAYNGWCAYAMAKTGKLVSINPKRFKVVDGRVFLFYSNMFSRTLVRWNKEKSQENLINAGDQNWLKYSEH